MVCWRAWLILKILYLLGNPSLPPVTWSYSFSIMTELHNVSRRRFDILVDNHRLCAEFIDPSTKGRANTKPTLVFLHEGFGSIGQWGDFPAALSMATGCPALLYDRYGYGNSAPLIAPLSLRYMHEEALNCLPQVLKQCKIDDPILVGQSDGASIALIFAGVHTDRVRGVISEAAHVFIEDITIEGIREAVKAFDTTSLRELLARYHGENTEMMFRSWTNLWLSPESKKWNIEEYLPGITCPVLAIQGQDDEYGTVSQIESIAARVSGPVESMLVPKCAHVPHHQAREEVLTAMMRFITTPIKE
jgi:pimeloyl-ACP methyl ester carboxylesterase